MVVEFSQLEPGELDELNVVDSRNFGYAPINHQPDVMARVIEPGRFVVAKDSGAIVGGAGSYPMELTLPGGATVPTSGVTWVSVSPTHTRQGITRTMMEMLRVQSVERGEPILALSASEGGIYERFGYGVSTFHRFVSIDRSRNRLRPSALAEGGGVHLVDPFEHVDEIMSIYDRYRRSQVGEMSRSADMFNWVFKPKEQELRVGAIHSDGFAMWSINPDWNDSHPRHGLELIDFFAVTDNANRALWQTVLSVDLVEQITARSAVAPDDPLPLLMEDQRGVRTSGLRDHLWLRVEDPVTCFSARTYRSDDSFTVGVVDDIELDQRFDGSFKKSDFETVFSVSAGGASRSRRRPDVAVTRAALGPLLLGSVSATTLAGGHRLSAKPGLVDRLDVFFGVLPSAHCRTYF